MVDTIKEELDNFLLSCGFDRSLFYRCFPIEFLTEYEWKFIGEDCLEVYDNEGYNIKHIFPDIYFEDCDGFYDKHEKYIVFVTSALNHRIKVLTVLDKRLEIKL